MSFVLPVMYHWSPPGRREKIAKRGLRASTPTLAEIFGEAKGPRQLKTGMGMETVKAVCLGTSPSHAWSLCGAIWGQRGETWDLWQVSIAEDDRVVVLPNSDGNRLGEVRVCGNIPRGRVWHIGERTVGRQKWSIDK